MNSNNNEIPSIVIPSISTPSISIPSIVIPTSQQIIENKCSIDHLVFVIHGIGKHDQEYYDKVEKMNKKSNLIYQTMMNCHVKSTTGTPEIDQIKQLGGSVKFIAIEWHNELQKKIGDNINNVKPKGIPNIRSMVDETLMDFILWTSPTYSSYLCELVINKLNEAYNFFMHGNPHFKGTISILAHSLGSIICFDILSNDRYRNLSSDGADQELQQHQQIGGNVTFWRKYKSFVNKSDDINNTPSPRKVVGLVSGDEIQGPHLTFNVDNLFCLGSPIGLLLSIRGYENGIPIPNCKNLFNIYNDLDPVAHLIEPLIDSKYKSMEEEKLPKYDLKKKEKKRSCSFSGLSSPSLPSTPTSLNLNNEMDSDDDDDSSDTPTDMTEHSDIGSIDSTTFEKLTITRTKPVNIPFFAGYRFDYKYKTKGLASLTEYSAIVTSHVSYWRSKQILYFILCKVSGFNESPPIDHNSLNSIIE